MLTPSGLNLTVRRCPHLVNRFILPLTILGALGFLINSRISLIPSIYCYPKINIVFLKTHKCASSSIQNILMRYGDVHNLTFALPARSNYIGHPDPFSRAFLAHPLLPHYNILTHHTRLNYSEIRNIMPANSMFITILRDPVDLFESLYSYYGFDTFMRGDIHKFIKVIPRFKKQYRNKRFRNKFGVNQMSFDLGMDSSMFENYTLVQSYLDQLDSWFDLILIADKMDESLILLKHHLCWSIDDVVVFRMNRRDPKFKSKLSPPERLKLQELNRADVLLYNRFKAKFETLVDDFGRERMASEIAELRQRTQLLYDRCVTGEVQESTSRSPSKLYVNLRVMTFETRNSSREEICDLLTMRELVYTSRLRTKQTPLDSNETNEVL